MGRPEKPVDPTRRSIAAFARDLRRLREQAGTPTYRELARRARFSQSVLSSAASGHRLPSLPVALAFVAACGGDQETWRRRWLQARGGGDAPPAAGSGPARQRDSDQHRTPRPAELPLRPRGFATRKETLHRLTTGALTPPVVISGPFGVGKSELALRFAHHIAGCMDGQLYADLAPFASGGCGAHAVLDGFLSVLGMPADRLPDSAEQRAGLYRSLLAERRLVVLLDNVRDERQVRPLLGESRHSLTIMVSRTALLGLRDVRRIRLDVLSRAESMELITAMAPDYAKADPGACDRLAEVCGDLPLALDIALRKLAARPDVPLRDVIGRLAEPGVWLEWLRVGDLSVREPLGSTYRQLSDPARMLLHLLVSFRTNGWPHHHAGGDVADELVEAGMLGRRPGDGDPWVNPFVRAYLLAQGWSLDSRPT